jgi:hypothetical protein
MKSNAMTFQAPSGVFRDYISLYGLCRECFDFQQRSYLVMNCLTALFILGK